MRRLIGALILLVAAVTVIAVPGLLRPGVAGTAFPAPIPPPPSPASCVVLRAGGTVVPADCALAHDGEVVAVWRASDAAIAGVTAETCAQLGSLSVVPRYTQDVAGWQASPVASVSLVVRAPAALQDTANDWAACVVTAGGPQFSGSLTEVFGLDAVPDVFRRCSAGPRPSACALPHHAERIAGTDGSLTDDYTGGSPDGRVFKVQLSLQQSCEAVAATVTGVRDPTYGGRLAVEVVVDSTDSYKDPTSWYGTSFRYQAGCVLRTTAGLLTASLVGLGDDPLPVA